jgi:hypothetical protein
MMESATTHDRAVGEPYLPILAQALDLEVQVQVVVPGHSFPHAWEEGAVIIHGLDADVHVSRHRAELQLNVHAARLASDEATTTTTWSWNESGARYEWECSCLLLHLSMPILAAQLTKNTNSVDSISVLLGM